MSLSAGRSPEERHEFAQGRDLLLELFNRLRGGSLVDDLLLQLLPLLVGQILEVVWVGRSETTDKVKRLLAAAPAEAFVLQTRLQAFPPPSKRLEDCFW